MTKLPKPRKIDGRVDEILWVGALHKAKEDMEKKFGGARDWESKYDQMCEVGRVLLAEELHRTTQKI